MGKIVLRIATTDGGFRITTSKSSTVDQLKGEVAKHLGIDPVSHTISVRGKGDVDGASICGEVFKRGQKLNYTFKVPPPPAPAPVPAAVPEPAVPEPELGATKSDELMNSPSQAPAPSPTSPPASKLPMDDAAIATKQEETLLGNAAGTEWKIGLGQQCSMLTEDGQRLSGVIVHVHKDSTFSVYVQSLKQKLEHVPRERISGPAMATGCEVVTAAQLDSALQSFVPVRPLVRTDYGDARLVQTRQDGMCEVAFEGFGGKGYLQRHKVHFKEQRLPTLPAIPSKRESDNMSYNLSRLDKELEDRGAYEIELHGDNFYFTQCEGGREIDLSIELHEDACVGHLFSAVSKFLDVPEEYLVLTKYWKRELFKAKVMSYEWMQQKLFGDIQTAPRRAALLKHAVRRWKDGDVVQWFSRRDQIMVRDIRDLEFRKAVKAITRFDQPADMIHREDRFRMGR